MKVEGVVIRITPYKEHGAMFNVLTKDELLSFYISNIYKINSQNVLLTTPLMYGNFTLTENKINRLSFKDMTPLIDNRNYMNDFNKLAVLNFLNEVTLRLINEEDMPQLYPYLVNAITSLKNNELQISLGYLACVLKITGNSLNVDGCVYTGNTQNIVGVSYLDGGLVSKAAYHSGNTKLYSANKIKILKTIFKLKPDDFKNLNFNKKDTKEVLEDLIIFAYDQTGVRLKSEKLIQKIN